MKLRVASFAFLLVGAAQARADFLPENDLHLQDSVEFAGNVTEEEFNAVIDQAEELFVPIAAAHGGKLKVKRDWEKSNGQRQRESLPGQLVCQHVRWPGAAARDYARRF